MTIMAILCIMFQVDLLFQVTMWYFDIKSRSLFLCSVTLWIEVDPQVSNQASQFATTAVFKCKLQQNLVTTTGNFIHVQLQPPCLLPASVWCSCPIPQL